MQGHLFLPASAVMFEIEGVSGCFILCVDGGTEGLGNVPVETSESAVSMESSEGEKTGDVLGASFAQEGVSLIVDCEANSYSNN